MPQLAVAALIACCIASAASLAPAVACAHSALTSPAPRDDSDGYKDPDGPCGVPRTIVQPTTTLSLAAGSTATITWNETVSHPGCFVLDFSILNDSDWVTLATVAHDPTGIVPRMYSAQVNLPGAPCTACTLRLRQIMLTAEPAVGAACPPADLDPGLTYYSCANVVLADAVQAGGSAGTEPKPTQDGCACAMPGGASGRPSGALSLGLALTLAAICSRLGKSVRLPWRRRSRFHKSNRPHKSVRFR